MTIRFMIKRIYGLNNNAIIYRDSKMKRIHYLKNIMIEILNNTSHYDKINSHSLTWLLSKQIHPEEVILHFFTKTGPLSHFSSFVHMIMDSFKRKISPV